MCKNTNTHTCEYIHYRYDWRTNEFLQAESRLGLQSLRPFLKSFSSSFSEKRTASFPGFSGRSVPNSPIGISAAALQQWARSHSSPMNSQQSSSRTFPDLALGSFHNSDFGSPASLFSRGSSLDSALGRSAEAGVVSKAGSHDTKAEVPKRSASFDDKPLAGLSENAAWKTRSWDGGMGGMDASCWKAEANQA
jgi:hypothetical protein